MVAGCNESYNLKIKNYYQYEEAMITKTKELLYGEVFTQNNFSIFR